MHLNTISSPAQSFVIVSICFNNSMFINVCATINAYFNEFIALYIDSDSWLQNIQTCDSNKEGIRNLNRIKGFQISTR